MDLEDIVLPLPQRLKIERRRLKLTQEQFGKLGGVTQTYQCLFTCQPSGNVPAILFANPSLN